MITNRDCLVILTIILRKKMEKMENINYLLKNLKIELKKKLLKYLKNVFFLNLVSKVTIILGIDCGAPRKHAHT